MTKDDIIRMAREAGFNPVSFMGGNFELFKRYTALVAATERNRTWTQAHWTEYERSIAAAEREACAKVCEQKRMVKGGEVFAAAIRAMGEK
jgi:hypothetical protein